MEPRGEVLLETRLFRVVRRRQRLADGTSREREVILHPGAAVVIPMVDEQRVCLIWNYRIAVEERMLELPAGTLNPGEDPDETARRELEEETGYRAGRIEKLAEFFMSPGILHERTHLYLARDLKEGPAAREPGEEIENVVVPWDEAMRLVEAGKVRDAKTLVGLLYYDRLRAGRS